MAPIEEMAPIKEMATIKGDGNVCNRTQILSHYNLTLRDFETVEAGYKTADKFIRLNAEEFGHRFQCLKDPDGEALLDRFFFVKGRGMEKSWNQKEEQKLQVKPKQDISNKKMLAGVTTAMELLGKPDAESVKQEHQRYGALKKQIDLLRIVEW